MLFADRAHGNALAVAVLDRRAKNGLTEKDTFAVVPKRPMTKIGQMRFAFVEPVMDREIIFRPSPEQLRRPDCVMVGMSHGQPMSSLEAPNTASAFFSSVIVQASKSIVRTPRSMNSPASKLPMIALAASSISP